MITRSLPVLLASLSLCAVALAEDKRSSATTERETFTVEELEDHGALDAGPALALERSDVYSTVGGSISIHNLPAVTLLDGRRFPLSNGLGRMGTTLDVLPLAFLSAVDVQKVGNRPAIGSGGPGGVVDLQLKRGYEFGGEVGFLYGKSSGKYGREDFESYIIGGVGNDKFNITAGYSYRESSGRIPRWSR
ncbi:MAG: hypothetical protein ABI883_02635 [Chthoniobacterales bacterium]